jgi:uncharacterized protein (TIGR00106 family)
MIAEFSICPMGTEHMSTDVAKVVEILAQSGLPYWLGPMGSCVEGSLDEVLSVVRRCHEMTRGKHDRVITTIVIDDRGRYPHHLRDRVGCVESMVWR